MIDPDSFADQPADPADDMLWATDPTVVEFVQAIELALTMSAALDTGSVTETAELAEAFTIAGWAVTYGTLAVYFMAPDGRGFSITRRPTPPTVDVLVQSINTQGLEGQFNDPTGAPWRVWSHSFLPNVGDHLSFESGRWWVVIDRQWSTDGDLTSLVLVVDDVTVVDGQTAEVTIREFTRRRV
jgi:hypothetical protein